MFLKMCQRRTLYVPQEGHHEGCCLNFFFTWNVCILCLLLCVSQWWTHISLPEIIHPKNTSIFFIIFQEPSRNIYAVLLVQISKRFGHPFCANFTIHHHELWQISKCAATADNIIHWSSLIKTHVLLMRACMRDVDGHADWALSVTLVLHTSNLSTFPWIMLFSLLHWANILGWIPAGFTSAQRNLNTVRCSPKVKSHSGAFMFVGFGFS